MPEDARFLEIDRLPKSAHFCPTQKNHLNYGAQLRRSTPHIAAWVSRFRNRIEWPAAMRISKTNPTFMLLSCSVRICRGVSYGKSEAKLLRLGDSPP